MPPTSSQAGAVRAVWRGLAVGDDALTSCIQELRQALGDDGPPLHRDAIAAAIEPVTVISEAGF
jgi:hypothetical protein